MPAGVHNPGYAGSIPAPATNLPEWHVATFTTWAALKQKMLDDLAGNNLAAGDLTKGSLRIVYRNQAEWQKWYDFVCQAASVEAGTAGTTGSCRTYARDGGRC